MDPIAVTWSLESVQTVMLASVRVAGFLVVAPPFSSRGVPGTVKVALALAIGTAVSSRVEPLVDPSGGVFVMSLIGQAVVGLTLGFAVQLVVSAVQIAGTLLDQFGGFSMGQAFDPLNMTQSSELGRFYSYLATALLFVTDGYQMVLGGLVRTFDGVPLDGMVQTSAMAEQFTSAFSAMLLGAVQIAGPLVLVLFLTDIGLGLLTKVAPALNAFAMGFPLKILVTLVMVGFALLAMQQVVEGLAADAVRLISSVVGG